jgi:murein DD-endopeptidase MepM/ murein hydrolase activator NlpD
LAVVRTNEFIFGLYPRARYKLYLDGVYRPKDGGGDLTVSVTDPRLPVGFLRLGTNDPSPKTSDSQFYGFIDDVAVFDEALSAGQIAGLAFIARLFGGEPHLLAGYTFDTQLPSGQPLPAKLNRNYDIQSPALRTQVTTNRGSFADSFLLPRPVQQVPLRLPFAKGEVWHVVQGWEGPASHHGYAGFCLDFVYAVIEPVTGIPVPVIPAGKGRSLYASAPGTVRVVEDGGAAEKSKADDPNNVQVEHAPNEFTIYRHILTGSPSALGVQPGDVLALGQKLAEVGTTGGPNDYHLHLAATNDKEVGNFRTIPVEFSNYEYWDADDHTWRFISRGVPQVGQFVRRPWYVFDGP